MTDLDDRAPEPPPLELWIVAELFGHKRIAGKLTEQVIAGAKFARIDVPNADGSFTTKLYSPKSFYSLHPTSEELARKAAQVIGVSPPIHEYELRALTSGREDEPIDPEPGEDDDEGSEPW